MRLGPVSVEKWAKCEQRRVALGVRAEDLEESFVRSGGPGGQHVNKASTCVLLRHRPTGLQVKCQSTRHQALNRFLARRRLLDKIERQQHGVVAAEQARIAKIRRQKHRRSRRARERLLADKRHRSARKAGRRPVSDE
ncbi:peptide chain release factor-like protein [bacterium]|nr:peptide chain release factor-like protein [bacterium]